MNSVMSEESREMPPGIDFVLNNATPLTTPISMVENGKCELIMSYCNIECTCPQCLIKNLRQNFRQK